MVEAWASWEGGVNLIASLRPGHDTPDLIVQVARLLRTPRGDAPAAYVRWQREGEDAALFEAVLSPDLEVGRFNKDLNLEGFTALPVHSAALEILDVGDAIVARLEFAWHELEIRFDRHGPLELFDRPYELANARMTGVEAPALGVTARLDGRPYPLARILHASWMPAGVIARC